QQSSLTVKSQRPDVFRLRLEEDLRFAVGRNAVDLAVRRRARVYTPLRVNGQRHHVEFGSFIEQRSFARRINLENAPFVPRPEIDVARVVGGGGPDVSLFGVENLDQ